MNNISLAITAYSGDCRLLPATLEYFTHQTFCPYEIIVYVSNVDSINIPKTLHINNQIIPIHQVISTKRTMQSVARNVCASIATGDIVIFFDVDDIPHPQKLEITNYIFHHANVDFLLHNFTSNNSLFPQIDVNTLILKDNLQLNPNNTNLMCENWPIHHAHIAVKKYVFQNIKFNESLEMYRKEDGKFCQDLISNDYTGYYCTSPLVSYTT